MTAQQILDAIAADPALQAMRDAGNYQGIAEALPPDVVIGEYFIGERGVRSLDVAPTSRKALLDTLRDAATTTPAWIGPVMDAAGVSEADKAVYIDDLSSANRWLLMEGGINVGASGARIMLDMIAAGVPAAAEACAAVKALAETTQAITLYQVQEALNNGG